MKRLAKRASIVLAMTLIIILLAGPIRAFSQAAFNIPFEFKAAGKKIPAGEYWLGLSGEGQLLLRQISTGKELLVPFTEKLSPPDPPVGEPRLVFDEVGDFAPSYTEYLTVYVLSEVWLSGEEGFLVHTTKGAHKEKTIKGVRAEKEK
ncbi:MAG: hypothetical protein QHH14_00120 [Clostridiales bacterium]|nr:hypothetical protein [Clostridiales bacterium]